MQLSFHDAATRVTYVRLLYAVGFIIMGLFKPSAFFALVRDVQRGVAASYRTADEKPEMHQRRLSELIINLE